MYSYKVQNQEMHPELTPIKDGRQNCSLLGVDPRLGVYIVGQPVQEGVAHQLREEQAHRELDHTGDLEGPDETNCT